MTGAEPGAARAYHDATKHSWASVRSDHHHLDWETKPFPFKIYPDAPAVPLPREVTTPGMPALEALARVATPAGRGDLDVGALAQLLFFSAGLTRKTVYPAGETIHFRAAASTGALYQTEVYLVAGAIPALEPGIYHFSPGDFALRRLRRGDFRAALADTAGDPDRVRTASATLVLSAIYWRNTWKYRARAYRHFFWDAGTMLANLLAIAVAADLPARILLGFADAPVNQLLGLDVARETSLVLVPMGPESAPPPPPPVEPLALATIPLSPRAVDYPLVRAAVLASALPDGFAARAWSEACHPVASPAPALPAGPSLGEVILRRGSTRQFAHEPITLTQLSTLLDTAVQALPLDAGGADRPVVDLYVLVHAVEGLAAGAYVYEPAARRLRLLRAGEFRSEGGYLCLEQTLGADASAVVFFLADLGPVLARYGDRGYRAVNLAAGLLGGRLYLGAYALGLGATGLTFYDDDVVRFFSPDAAGKDAIFVMALGRAHRVRRRGGLAQVEGTVRPLRPGEA